MSYCREYARLIDQLPTNINCNPIDSSYGLLMPDRYFDLVTEAISEECDSAMWTTVKSLYDWYCGCGYFLLSYTAVPESNITTSDVGQTIIDTLNSNNILYEWNNQPDCRIKVFSTPIDTCFHYGECDLTLFNFERTSIHIDDHEAEEQSSYFCR